MGSAFHQLCPRYSGTLTPTAPMAVRLLETFSFLFHLRNICIVARRCFSGRDLFSSLQQWKDRHKDKKQQKTQGKTF